MARPGVLQELGQRLAARHSRLVEDDHRVRRQPELLQLKRNAGGAGSGGPKRRTRSERSRARV